MGDQTEQKTSDWNVTYVALALIVLLIFYALSIGPVTLMLVSLPATWLQPHAETIRFLYATIYYPLILLMNNSHIVAQFYSAYYDLLGIPVYFAK